MSPGQNVMLMTTQGVTLICVAILLLEFAHKDFKNKTMKNYVGCGISLFKVYFVKLIVCMVAVFILLLFSTITEQIGYCILEHRAITTIAFSNLILRVICTLLMSAVIFFICSLVSNGAISILLSVVYLAIPFIFSAIEGIPKAISPFLIANYINIIAPMANPMVDTCSVAPGLRLLISLVVVFLITLFGAFLYSKRTVK